MTMLTFRFFKTIFLQPATIILLFASGASPASTVIIQTSLGDVPIQLYDTTTPPMTPAPQTVANFLNYVNNGAYGNSFFQRSVPGFIIQAGGYTWNDAANGVRPIPTNPPVPNEFSPTRSNLRGTIAMAKVGGNPNSATSQWFINLADNSANLDNQNGGFTVFGQVTGNGMSVVDAIAALPTVNAGGDFSTLPIIPPVPPSGGGIQKSNLVVYSVVSQSQWDCLFNWAERNYSSLFSPPSTSQSSSPYYYRYYPGASYYSGTNSYLGVSTANGHVYYLSTASTLQDVGPVSGWLTTAGCN